MKKKSMIFFLSLLAFSCRKSPEMTLEEIAQYKSEAAKRLLERTHDKPWQGEDFVAGKVGGVWNDSLLADPKTFNQLIAERDGTSAGILSQTLDYLVDYDTVKKSWKARAAFFEIETNESKGILTVHYTLRENLVWSWFGKDETFPVTSDDVVFWYNEIAGDEEFQSSSYSSQFVTMQDGSVSHIDCIKIDDKKFDFVFPRIVADPLLATNMQLCPSFIYKKAKEEGGADGVKNLFNASIDPAGIPSMGRWLFAQYKPGQRLVYKRNPNFWDKDENGQSQPYPETMIMQIIGERNTEYLLFRQGKVETFSPSPEEAHAVVNSQGKDYTVFRSDGALSAPLWTFNQNPQNSHEKFYKWTVKKEFRQAMSCLLNRERIISQTYRGLAQAHYGFFPEPNPFYNPEITLHYRYNKDEAISLLKKIGISRDSSGVMRDEDGNKIEFDLTIQSTGSTISDIAQIIADECASVGIKVNVRQVDFQKLVEMLTATYDWQTLIVALGGGNIFPSQGSNVWPSSGNLHMWNPLQKTPATNWEARLDYLYNEGCYTSSRDAAQKIWDEFQTIILEQCPVIYLVGNRSFFAIRNVWDLTNFYFDNMNGALTEHIFLREN